MVGSFCHVERNKSYSKLHGVALMEGQIHNYWINPYHRPETQFIDLKPRISADNYSFLDKPADPVYRKTIIIGENGVVGFSE